ncbi:3-deoxy-D-manno-octulosonic acid kinase [Glaciecola siphonariae]|uniref:3-deoxy-D-manno-octulosonic acid kinase n=1 Tax=Glaciecola siphonariae TaxID=521012 RepID=A0ABV9LVZ5_9ALTE
MSIDVQTAPNNVSLLRTELGQSLNLGLKHFDLDYLEGKNAVTKTAQGRGKVYFFKHQDRELALRHYHRGGLMGAVNHDRFLYTGMFRTRGFQELQILDFLNYHNVAVPRPIAARISRNGLAYRADIITEVIPDAQELHEMLKLHEVDEQIWVDIGKTLARLHQLNVRHDDINVKNVLIQHNKNVVIIDFDKCKLQDVGNWRSANIARFYRSLIKQYNKHKPYYFAQSNWEALQSGYSEVIGV